MSHVFLSNQGLYDDSDCDSAELDHSGSAEPSQPPGNWWKSHTPAQTKKTSQTLQAQPVNASLTLTDLWIHRVMVRHIADRQEGTTKQIPDGCSQKYHRKKTLNRLFQKRGHHLNCPFTFSRYICIFSCPSWKCVMFMFSRCQMRTWIQNPLRAFVIF